MSGIRKITAATVLLLPLLLPALLLTLGFYQKSQQDSRYGLHPFTKIIAFKNYYYWEDVTGRKYDFSTGNELRGREASKLNSNGWHIGYYGEGAIAVWSKAYLKYMCKNLVPQSAFRCSSKVEYYINPLDQDLASLGKPKSWYFDFNN